MEFQKCLFKSNKACLSHQEICDLIDERIAFHTRGDEMEQIIFCGQDSAWNTPQYSKLKNKVSEHVRQAELDSVIVLIEHQRLKSLQIEELKLKLELLERGKQS
jgi:hypothetical protein